MTKRLELENRNRGQRIKVRDAGKGLWRLVPRVMTPRHTTVPKVQAVQSAESWLSRDKRARVM
jgi:hypothetical protein